MSKNKSVKTPHYELLYIVSNKYTEDELKPIIEKANSIIRDQGGAVTYSEDWGKRRLAYPIEHMNHGYYFLVEFDLESKKIDEISNSFNMAQEILRFQVVAKEARTLEEIRHEKEKKEDLVKKEIIAKKEEREKEEPKEVKEEGDKKVDLKDLDEKLDKILDTDDLL
jgi:small subunit ribosomal protein S6